MLNQKNKILLVIVGLAFCGNLFYIIWFQPAMAQTTVPAIQKNNPELEKMYLEDQSDRKPPKDKPVDWESISARDSARLKRVKELLSQNRLLTGADFYHAAMILQHGTVPEDYLLAHELCVVAITKGEERAKWLAAASEDRFLMKIGRPQRFGTQYNSEGKDKPFRLYPVDPTVTDELRSLMKVRTLKEARDYEAELNRNK